jgi:predicted RNA-binding Zn-ribbon protein involved in translation (DUF1610 family)
MAYEDNAPETLPCPACGAEIYEEAERCPACGDFVVMRVGRTPGRWWWVAAVLALVGMVLYVAAA